MASYTEIANLFNQNTLRDKICVAVADAALTIATEDAGTANHANRLIWAKRAYSSPVAVAQEIAMAVLIANKAFTVAQITGATDAALLTAVLGVVNIFATGA